MRTIVLRPPGPGPFPLVVISHGSVETPELRLKASLRAYEPAAQWFVRRGYAVALPQRPGHGATGGPYLEDQNGCDHADYRRSGLATAASIEAAVKFMVAQRFVKQSGTVIVGQSAGGWGALALASRNTSGVRAVINFAGGRGGRVNGGPNNNCAPERLVAAAGTFGASARIPVLAIYTENDSYFPAVLSKRLADAFRSAGGRIEYRLLPRFDQEGHWLFESRDGIPAWGPIVEEFLARMK